MTPSARFAAAVELLGFIEAAATPADQQVTAYFRVRRYAGSKDRRWISEFVYRCLRRKGELDWSLEALGLDKTSRNAGLLSLVLFDQVEPRDIAENYFGGSHGLAELDGAEEQALAGASSLDTASMPPYAAANFPEWISDLLQSEQGENAGPLMAAYQQRAPVTLRVNRLKTDREEARRLLVADGIEVTPTSVSPDGLTLNSRRNISRHPLLDQGLLELQDEAAQISARLADVRPGMQVVDYCAGGGGKSLALAALMQSQGKIHAFDVNARRMRDIKSRSRRATTDIIEPLVISGDDSDSDLLQPLTAQMPRVFVDAPCSGSGTWRRQPDQKWNLSAERLGEFAALQQGILERASRLVAPGGRLVYATCSIFEAENERQIDSFLAHHPDYKIMPVSQLWPEVGLEGTYEGAFLKLTPLDFGSDGFFTAILEKSMNGA
ncbi:RsmB/NOP family class I SAM-dependent RNA methyltransferase [Sneathiella marina]|uniref:RsmB/NOP family class I SAM-dependent RNA methyltransferase n=1 Tax=Sneathiella marina TaxID=2950108 RepID=A0ABY4VYL2_9PROT|nr:RsmB/NOP family class I SAM-dependent RNA methyltransferase [Sneathiella marina]USG60020.1 RsmB/NOP family class I SAM-dependent RNA methyltransferase [Sneathiella marina]